MPENQIPYMDGYASGGQMGYADPANPYAGWGQDPYSAGMLGYTDPMAQGYDYNASMMGADPYGAGYGAAGYGNDYMGAGYGDPYGQAAYDSYGANPYDPYGANPYQMGDYGQMSNIYEQTMPGQAGGMGQSGMPSGVEIPGADLIGNPYGAPTGTAEAVGNVAQAAPAAVPGAPAQGAQQGAPAQGAPAQGAQQGAQQSAPAQGAQQGAPAQGAQQGAPAQGAPTGIPQGAPQSNMPPNMPRRPSIPIDPSLARSGRAKTALILAILSILFSLIAPIGVLLSILSLRISGSYKRNGGNSGAGDAARIFGFVGLIFSCIILALFIWFFGYYLGYGQWSVNYVSPINYWNNSPIGQIFSLPIPTTR